MSSSPPGYLPTPRTGTSSSQPTHTSSSSQDLGGTNKFIYVYTFITVLFILLVVALFVLVRALLYRRRLQDAFNSADAAPELQQQPARRRKKRKLGSKPLFLDAWMGNGPLSTSLSSEDLLKHSQPFSAARKPTEEAHVAAISEKNHTMATTTTTVTVLLEEAEPDSERISKPQLLNLLSASQAKSASSCTEEMTSASAFASASALSSPPLPNPIPELEQVQVGFFIAMPRQRPTPRSTPTPKPSLRSMNSSSTLKGKNGGEEEDEDDEGDNEWPAMDSRWSDYLFEGELPEMTVGVSTISIPVQTLDGLFGQNGSHGSHGHYKQTKHTQHSQHSQHAQNTQRTQTQTQTQTRDGLVASRTR